MTPEEKTQFDELKRRVELLERFDNIDNVKFVRERIVGAPSADNDTAVDRSITVGAGGGTFDVLDYPDGFLEFTTPAGDKLKVPFYSLTRF